MRNVIGLLVFLAGVYFFGIRGVLVYFGAIALGGMLLAAAWGKQGK